MITIIDNGSQYSHLIRRNMRDLGKDTELVPNKGTPLESVMESGPDAVILSGGPSSVTKGKNFVSGEIVREAGKGWDVPILGICYGHQLIAHELGGKVGRGKSAEYGLGKVVVDEADLLLARMPREFTAWVSHFDEVKELPHNFISLAHSDTCRVEAMRHVEKRIFGCQFHPEVWHTEKGEWVLENFLSCL